MYEYTVVREKNEREWLYYGVLSKFCALSTTLTVKSKNLLLTWTLC